ncbi:hypothetical protein PhaeoP83_01298 [Phaeobacter inhibens]|uniref:Uncharacterized protein n=1 Tax=Phaeobacter inhibens TaxID=221822 RepID=A0A2I7KA34_9RHOB|nr:hypothetical protein PhaeoP83_01298 [Phaeobacter inhibens]AUQ70829.1 hypothetical protein PhaeoP54_01944 [Phaeobacter inhibens]AUQ94139.1 hypothetical protein PhaeoP66_01345 [Phaeobacter inhibens]AUQ99445.1 hypothetical protein PhaeoP88_02079 [Phaeobacter inhibens]AUR19387.1 hypothetical protein PhaeoP80_01298 [Phaeobacter inhibens]
MRSAPSFFCLFRLSSFPKYSGGLGAGPQFALCLGPTCAAPQNPEKSAALFANIGDHDFHLVSRQIATQQLITQNEGRRAGDCQLLG